MKDWENIKRRNDVMEVELKASGILKPFITDKTIKLKKGSSLSDLLNLMITRYGTRFKEIVVDPETKGISASICILVNGKTINDFEEKLVHGDEVNLFIFVAGG